MQSSHTYVEAPEDNQDKCKRKCIKKVSIILSVVLVVVVAVGIYFAVMSKEDNTDLNIDTCTRVPYTADQPSDISTTISLDSTDVMATDDDRTNGTVFNTDPICRDFLKSSIFVFDCYHQRAFNSLPDNDTVKCGYLNRVGLCIQALLEDEYGVDCNRLDQLYLLNLNSEAILERSNFDVKTRCDGWYAFYQRSINGAM